MAQVLVLLGVAALVGALVAGGRALAGRELRRLRGEDPSRLWAVLGERPDGHPTVVAFSTPGCVTCRVAQRPALAVLRERSGGRLRVIEVDAATRPEVARAFGVLTSPATVVLDAAGAVLAANQGFASADLLAAQLGLEQVSA